VVNKLENSTLDIGEGPIGALPESAALELKYKTHRSGKSLTIEIDWQDSEEMRREYEAK